MGYDHESTRRSLGDARFAEDESRFDMVMAETEIVSCKVKLMVEMTKESGKNRN